MAGKKGSEGRIGRETNLVTNGTTVNAVKQKRTAEDCMCATSVGRVDTKERNVSLLLTGGCLFTHSGRSNRLSQLMRSGMLINAHPLEVEIYVKITPVSWALCCG